MKRKKWHADGRTVKTKLNVWAVGSTVREAVTIEESSYVCSVATQTYDKKLELQRAKLIAMLPDLIYAADVLNGVAKPNRNTIPSVRKELRDADKVVRKARALLAAEPAHVPYQ